MKYIIPFVIIFVFASCLKELKNPELDKDEINNIFDPSYENYDVWLKQVKVDSIQDPNFSIHYLLKFRFEIINSQLIENIGDYFIYYIREGKNGPSSSAPFVQNGKHYCIFQMNNFNSTTGKYCFSASLATKFAGITSGNINICWEF